MAPKATWLLRLTEIQAAIEAMQAPLLDRASLELAFGVRRRRAIELMHRFGGYQAGKTFLVDRTSLLRQLKAIEQGAEFQQERTRRRNLAEELDRTRLALPGKAVRIEAPAVVFDRHLADLPRVLLRRGELRIEFAGAEDLLRQLLELAMAIQNDFERFEEICQPV